jgi:putative zinc ribbon protein
MARKPKKRVPRFDEDGRPVCTDPECKYPGHVRPPFWDPSHQDDWKWHPHPVYGPIPYTPAGYVLEFRPQLPSGAVRGDPFRQTGFCPHCRPPKYFYVDTDLTCRQCGTGFLWPAEQQRHWYEVLKLSAAAGPPSRCPECRREAREARVNGRRLAEATAAVRERPDDVEALVEYAAAMAEHGRRLGSGDLARGIAAARKAARLDPRAYTARYWEGVCHDAAGRSERAAACYREFARAARTTRGLRKLVGRADQRIAELQAAGAIDAG